MLLSIVAYSAGVFFKRANVFVRESAMLKLQKDRRKWGESKGAGQRGRVRVRVINEQLILLQCISDQYIS